MPNENIEFFPKSQLLKFEEMARFVRIVAQRGVNKIRITGGEPLVRNSLPTFIRLLADIPQIEDIALTTNGILLADLAVALRESGLHRLNVSLDTMRESVFQTISRRSGLPKVIAGIHAARAAGFDNIRLNALAMPNVNEDDIIPLAEFARDHDFELRFIEFMPLDAEQNWNQQRVIQGETIRRLLEDHFGKLIPTERPDPSQPAVDYRFEDGKGRIGLINPVSQPFCHDCNRIRITADGKLRNCLFSTQEWDMRKLLRSEASDSDILEAIDSCLTAKKAAHGIDEESFQRPARSMYQIGG